MANIKKDVLEASTENKPVDGGVLKESGFKQLTVEQLEALASTDPDKAETYLNLYEKLRARKKTQVNDEQIIAMSIMNLKQIQKQAEMTYAAQLNCERMGHTRDGKGTALVGQTDNFHKLILVCQRCQKTYSGIGGATGELPMHLAQTLDTSLIGGVQ